MLKKLTSLFRPVPQDKQEPLTFEELKKAVYAMSPGSRRVFRVLEVPEDQRFDELTFEIVWKRGLPCFINRDWDRSTVEVILLEE